MENALSVTQLTKYIRLRIEQDDVLQQVCVRGELSNVTRHRSGHVYAKVKDEGSVISAVMFRTDASQLDFVPTDGQRVIVYGRVSVYEPYGNYQLYISRMQLDGIGVLYEAFDKLKKALSDEGLFDESHKKPIPAFPKTIGVITSPTGAAIRDILQILSRRYPSATVKLYPSLVQGEEAPSQLIKAVRWFDENNAADVLIIGRGGGSMEDLWAFNDQMLAYEIYRCKIPVISAVGHEIDFTICDFVADLRAPTPSAAAELAVPDSVALQTKVSQYKKALRKSLENKQTQAMHRLLTIKKHPVMQNALYTLSSRMQQLDKLSGRLQHATEGRLQALEKQFAAKATQLDALSPLKVLGRGYAIAEDTQHHPLSHLNEGDEFILRTSRQTAKCNVVQVLDKER